MSNEEYCNLLTAFQKKAEELWGHSVPLFCIPDDTDEMQKFVDGDKGTIDSLDRAYHPLGYAFEEFYKELDLGTNNKENKSDRED